MIVILVMFLLDAIRWIYHLFVAAVPWIVLVAVTIGIISLAYKLLTEKRGRP